MRTENFIRYILLSDITESDISQFYCTFHRLFVKSIFRSLYFFHVLQLFDKDNNANVNGMKYLFTTEGHILPLRAQYHKSPYTKRHRPATSKAKSFKSVFTQKSKKRNLKHVLNERYARASVRTSIQI